MEIPHTNYKLKWSNFHCTVQTNMSGEMEHIATRRLRKGIENMPKQPYVWEWLKQYKNGQQQTFGAADKILVERIRIRAAIEKGGTKNTGVHAHLIIEVAHKTMVQINKFDLQDHFQRYLKTVPNIHVRFLKGSGEDKNYILKYITKEVPRERPKDYRNDLIRYAFKNNNEITADNTL